MEVLKLMVEGRSNKDIADALWSYLFFSAHQIPLAFWEVILMNLTIIVLVILIWPLLKWASGLLVPYAAWVTFASYLTYSVLSLNK